MFSHSAPVFKIFLASPPSRAPAAWHVNPRRTLRIALLRLRDPQEYSRCGRSRIRFKMILVEAKNWPYVVP